MQLKGLHYRQSCPGGAYYVCQNGFKGCCSINPCDPNGTCPDTNTSTAVSSSSQTMSSSTTSSVFSSQTGSPTAASTSSSPSLTSSASLSSTKTSSSAISISTGLICPSANGTTYTDSSNVRYSIRCNADNSYDSFNSTVVGPGGFSQCFAACDQFTSCAGFTFVGTDSGNCYLKSNIPEDGYSNTSGSNYVTCAVLDRIAQQSPNSTDPTVSTQAKSTTPVGAIAGGVVGGVVVISLLGLLLFFCIRRRHKRTKERDVATQKSQPGPREPLKGEELFAPVGGYWRGNHLDTASPKLNTIYSDLSVTPAAGSTQPSNSKSSPIQQIHEDRALEHIEPEPITGPGELEGNPIYPPGHIAPAPVEMDATSPATTRNSRYPTGDSPVLGRYNSSASPDRRANNLAEEVRRRNHIMSWNNYDANGVVSPPMSFTMSSRIGSPDISPVVSDESSTRLSSTRRSP